MSNLFTKRWVVYFLLFYIVGYIVSFVLVSTLDVTSSPAVFVATRVFTPLWALLVGYLYFRHARNDWPARFATALGWLALMFLISAVLVEPVYGYDWTSILNSQALNANWINVAAILIGAIVAKKNQNQIKKITE